jgi:hypothetical protein
MKNRQGEVWTDFNGNTVVIVDSVKRQFPTPKQTYGKYGPRPQPKLTNYYIHRVLFIGAKYATLVGTFDEWAEQEYSSFENLHSIKRLV